MSSVIIKGAEFEAVSIPDVHKGGVDSEHVRNMLGTLSLQTIAPETANKGQIGV